MRSAPELTRLLALALALYVPHLAEEALTGMHDDVVIVSAASALSSLAPLMQLTPRHAVYLTFQAMLLVTLATTLAFALGGRLRLLVLAVLGVSLLGEAHHLVRALFTLRYNSGLATSLPLPLLGAHVLRVARGALTPTTATVATNPPNPDPFPRDRGKGNASGPLSSLSPDLGGKGRG